MTLPALAPVRALRLQRGRCPWCAARLLCEVRLTSRIGFGSSSDETRCPQGHYISSISFLGKEVVWRSARTPLASGDSYARR